MLINRMLMVIAIFGLLTVTGYTQAEPLTDAEVRRFIDAMGEMQTLADQYDNDVLAEIESEAGNKSAPDWSRVFSSSLERLEGTDLYSHIEDIARANDFENAQEYGRVGDRVFNAMMASEMGEQAPGVQAEMAKAMKEIERNPNMSAAQKKQMMEIMRGSMGMMDSVADAPEADIRTLRPHMEELRRVMEYEKPGQ